MQKNITDLHLNTYYKDLTIMHGVEFTPREVDVMTVFFSTRKTGKAVASFLSITPKTVETHKKNIMDKLGSDKLGSGYRSNEGIIKFIEASGKSSFIRAHYNNLLIQEKFKESLKKISELRKQEEIKRSIYFSPAQNISNPFLHHVKKDLNFAGFEILKKEIKPVHSFSPEKIHYNLCFINFVKKEEEFESIQKEYKALKNSIFLFLEDAPSKIDLNTIKRSFLSLKILTLKKEDYYLSFFKFLKNIWPHKDLEKILAEFKKYQDSFKDLSHVTSSINAVDIKDVETPKSPIPLNVFIKNLFPIKTQFILGGIFIIIIICGGIFELQKNTTPQIFSQDNLQKKQPIRSNLSIPMESNLLQRSQLIKKIEDKLKENQGIKTIALVGIGGGGKTTLARFFARSQKASVIYEINAENTESAINSFGELAENLAQNAPKNEREEFEAIQKVKESKEKERKILSFVKKQLKKGSDWILIYDNVESLSKIIDYFPQDSTIWGNGKIIITTLNSHINIDPNNIIPIEELTTEEAVTLFSKILFNCDPSKLHGDKKEKALIFLKNIPPFPLDITLAADYLNFTNISYEKYLDHLKRPDTDFEALQEKCLNEKRDYKKTRYKIIRTSLEKIMSDKKEFKDLLLFISLLNSQNIPKDLLELCQKNTVVESFIAELKKYSLITNSLTSSFSENATFSMHRSTQEGILEFLKNLLGLEKESSSLTDDQKKEEVLVLDNIIKGFTKYIERIIKTENLSQIKSLVPHMRSFVNHAAILNNSNFLSTTNFYEIKSKLGYLSYSYNLEPLEKTQDLLEELRKEVEGSQNQDLLIEIKRTLAAVYLNLGSIKKLKNIAEDISLHHRSYLLKRETLEVAAFFPFLGYVYSYLGENSEAKQYLEKSIEIYDKFPQKESINKAKSLSFLGDIARKEGHYKEALEKLRQSHSLLLQNDEGLIFWVLADIGITHKEMGHFKEAIDYLKESHEIYKKFYPSNHPDSALPLVHLGETYIEKACTEKSEASAKADYVEAEKNLNDSSNIMKNLNFKENNVRFVYSQIQLGNLKRLQKNDTDAETILEKSEHIYTENFGENSIRVWKVVYYLGCLYLDQKKWARSEELLKRALSILEDHKDALCYRVLESLGDLYDAQSQEKRRPQENIKSLREKALDYYRNALKKAGSILENNSVYVQRIIEKIKRTQNSLDILQKQITL